MNLHLYSVVSFLISVFQLTVLGACQCVFDTEPCPCSRTAAASRKQLVQLQQEVNVMQLHHCTNFQLFFYSDQLLSSMHRFSLIHELKNV